MFGIFLSLTDFEKNLLFGYLMSELASIFIRNLLNFHRLFCLLVISLVDTRVFAYTFAIKSLYNIIK